LLIVANTVAKCRKAILAGGKNPHEPYFIGERDGTRTHDLLIKSQLLYRLSYALVTMRKILAEPPATYTRWELFKDHARGPV
jgi:hypothetical protein